jgi:hypothetical protein
MFSVLIPTRVNSKICDPATDVLSVSDIRVWTRRGPLTENIHSAKRLARKHQGKVVEINSQTEVANYFHGMG